MNQYVIYRVKDTEIGKKLKHMPYNELGGTSSGGKGREL